MSDDKSDDLARALRDVQVSLLQQQAALNDLVHLQTKSERHLRNMSEFVTSSGRLVGSLVVGLAIAYVTWSGLQWLMDR